MSDTTATTATAEKLADTMLEAHDRAAIRVLVETGEPVEVVVTAGLAYYLRAARLVGLDVVNVIQGVNTIYGVQGE